MVELVQLVSGAPRIFKAHPKVPQSFFFSVFQASFPLVCHGATVLTAYLVSRRQPLIAEAAALYIHISAPAPPIPLTLPACLTRVHTVIANSFTQAKDISRCSWTGGRARSEQSAPSAGIPRAAEAEALIY